MGEGNNSNKNNTISPAEIGESDALFLYVSRKLEKISSALYMITSFFPEDEPLRISIRQKSLDLLSVTFSMKEKVMSDASNFARIIYTTINEVVSMLRVAKGAGLISDMNYEVLENEFRSLLSVTGVKHKELTGPLLSSSDFRVNNALKERAQQAIEKQDKGGDEEEIDLPLPPGSANRGAKGASTKGRRGKASGTKTKKKRRTSGAKRRRRKAIVDLVKDGREISVTDASDVIQGCSQKTIQRELASLVDEGVLKKTGKRRWSRYSLDVSSEEAQAHVSQ